MKVTLTYKEVNEILFAALKAKGLNVNRDTLRPVLINGSWETPEMDGYEAELLPEQD